MATYEYICLGCEHPFQERRPMTGTVQTAIDCPSCGSDRVRRKFSVFAAGGTAAAGRSGSQGSGGGCCGGACGCGT